MREDLVPAAEAREIILAQARPSGIEQIPLNDAAGRVLGEDLVALRTQPPFPASAMDGYALRAADASAVPATLKVIGIAAAGHPFRGRVGAGEAVRIFTGAPVPDGADSIVIQENAHAIDGAVEILEPAEPARHIRPAGLDFREGDRLVRAGAIMDPQRLSLAASMNHPEITVFRKPVVALYATGDELVPPGAALGDGQIIASNTYGLRSLITEAGGTVADFGIVADRTEAIIDTCRAALRAGADLIVSTGGASVGDHDLILPVLSSMGAKFHFSKIAMRPGKPFLYGTMAHQGRPVHLLGLAGNPVSSLIAGYMFMRPLVNALAGRPPALARPTACVLGCDLPANDRREDYQRAVLRRLANGQVEATPVPRQDSSMLAELNRADALLIRPANAPPAIKGDPAQVIILRQAP